MYAKKLEKEGVVRITFDEELFKKFGKGFPPSLYEIYEAEIKNILLEKIVTILKKGYSVVLDYGFWKKQERDFYRNFGKERNINIKTIFFKIPPRISKERIMERNKTSTDNDHYISIRLFNKFIKEFEPPVNEENTEFVLK